MTRQQLAEKYVRALEMTLEYLQRKTGAIDAVAAQEDTYYPDRSETMNEIIRVENAIRIAILRLSEIKET